MESQPTTSHDLYDQTRLPSTPSVPISPGRLTPRRLYAIRWFMGLRAELEQEVQWAAHVGPPLDDRFFAMETAFVIINSGMKAQIAWQIWERVRDRLAKNLPISGSLAFRHPGKTAAIDYVWENRESLFTAYQALMTDEARLDFLGSLPWIGPITRFHLAKNFGIHLAKPDRWLVRIADLHNCTPQELCRSLSEATGYPLALVDTMIWRCCNLGALRVESDGIIPQDPWLIAFFDLVDRNPDETFFHQYESWNS